MSARTKLSFCLAPGYQGIPSDLPYFRSRHFAAMLSGVCDTLCRVTNASYSIPYIGTGTASLDALIHNLIRPNSRVLVLTNGFFGDRLAQQIQLVSKNVTLLKFSFNQSINRSALLSHLSRAPLTLDFDFVAMVHAETQTGVLNNPKGILKIVSGNWLLLDAIGSFAADPLDLHYHEVDYAVFSSSKALLGPGGLGFILARNTDVIESGPVPFSMNLSTYIQYLRENALPFTAPGIALSAVASSLERISESPDSYYRVLLDNARAVRTTIAELGFELIDDDNCDLSACTTAVLLSAKSGVDVVPRFRDYLENTHRISFGIGLGTLSGCSIRVGHYINWSTNSIDALRIGLCKWRDFLDS